MSKTPREILLNTAEVLRVQAGVIRECFDSEDLATSLAEVQRAIDELRAAALSV
ncbi:hypothetical protein [Paeniglutamicibacter sulfureus]|uniref:Uncharacterized protein n=1 Tax=Paeniglutamicibacter sulfureus TaxID=43666 RepID=A0ABU2BQ10_9MICC|nr:hypothetical protein [Paeniglutamicibacter sulfureus]MDR7360371.1 hypothetical protein [Paeniglutamicibacter sulfureus]